MADIGWRWWQKVVRFTADDSANAADSASADASLFGNLSNLLNPAIDKNDKKNENEKREFFSCCCIFAVFAPVSAEKQEKRHGYARRMGDKFAVGLQLIEVGKHYPYRNLPWSINTDVSLGRGRDVSRPYN